MPRPLHFILSADGSVQAVDVSTDQGLADWCKCFELGRRVAFTEVAPGVEVSTVFLGLDHNHFGKGPPLLFETMTFDDYGGGDQWRYSTWDEAVKGHANAVAILRGKLVKRLAIDALGKPKP